MTKNFYKGQLLQIIKDQSIDHGGTDFGMAGDIIEYVDDATSSWASDSIYFWFKEGQSDWAKTHHSPEKVEQYKLSGSRAYLVYIHKNHVIPLVKDYQVDQEPLDDEETL
jgi:hypothetical protein